MVVWIYIVKAFPDASFLEGFRKAVGGGLASVRCGGPRGHITLLISFHKEGLVSKRIPFQHLLTPRSIPAADTRLKRWGHRGAEPRCCIPRSLLQPMLSHSFDAIVVARAR